MSGENRFRRQKAVYNYCQKHFVLGEVVEATLLDKMLKKTDVAMSSFKVKLFQVVTVTKIFPFPVGPVGKDVHNF